jgi:hypothetical protein
MVRSFVVLSAILLLSVVVGCGSKDVGPKPPPVSSPVQSESTDSGGGTESETASAVLPPELVGKWESQSTNATIAYRFLADGRYINVSILQQPRSSGLFEFSIEARGTATVDEDVLVLHPVSGTQSRKDPDAPSSDYTRPVSTESERFTWSADSSSLTLTDSDGVTITYERQ